MKLRRLATTVAATSALVLAGAAPALANHEVPQVVDGNPNCAAAVAALGDLAAFDSPDLVSLGKDESFGGDDMTADIDAADFPGFDIFVIVKGGDNAHVFFEPPFHELYAPENKGGQDPAISHIEVCGVPSEEPSPGEEEPPPGEEEPPPGEEENGEENGEDEEEPAAVPTEIPAGTGTAGAGSAGTAGLVAMLAAFAAGAAVIVRRRFLTES